MAATFGKTTLRAGVHIVCQHSRRDSGVQEDWQTTRKQTPPPPRPVNGSKMLQVLWTESKLASYSMSRRRGTSSCSETSATILETIRRPGGFWIMSTDGTRLSQILRFCLAHYYSVSTVSCPDHTVPRLPFVETAQQHDSLHPSSLYHSLSLHLRHPTSTTSVQESHRRGRYRSTHVTRQHVPSRPSKLQSDTDTPRLRRRQLSGRGRG